MSSVRGCGSTRISGSVTPRRLPRLSARRRAPARAARARGRRARPARRSRPGPVAVTAQAPPVRASSTVSSSARASGPAAPSSASTASPGSARRRTPAVTGSEPGRDRRGERDRRGRAGGDVVGRGLEPPQRRQRDLAGDRHVDRDQRRTAGLTHEPRRGADDPRRHARPPAPRVQHAVGVRRGPGQRAGRRARRAGRRRPSRRRSRRAACRGRAGGRWRAWSQLHAGRPAPHQGDPWSYKRARRGRAVQRGAERVGAEVLERAQQAADERQWLAVLLAEPLGLVAQLDEVRDGVAVRGQPGGPQHDGLHARPQRQVGELVGERGELAQLEDVVRGQLGGPVALGRDRRDRVAGSADLVVAQVEAGEDDRRAVEPLRDVDVGVDHGAHTNGIGTAGHPLKGVNASDPGPWVQSGGAGRGQRRARAAARGRIRA